MLNKTSRRNPGRSRWSPTQFAAVVLLLAVAFLSTAVHKYGNVFRYAAGRRTSAAVPSLFINAPRSALVKRQSNGVAIDS